MDDGHVIAIPFRSNVDRKNRNAFLFHGIHRKGARRPGLDITRQSSSPVRNISSNVWYPNRNIRHITVDVSMHGRAYERGYAFTSFCYFYKQLENILVQDDDREKVKIS